MMGILPSQWYGDRTRVAPFSPTSKRVFTLQSLPFSLSSLFPQANINN